MGLTAQLVQGVHLRVMGAEIAEEVADGAAVVTSSVGTERRTEGINRAIEERSQEMREG
jgi:cysteine synthase